MPQTLNSRALPRKTPFAVQNLGPRAGQPQRVVPVLHDRKAEPMTLKLCRVSFQGWYAPDDERRSAGRGDSPGQPRCVCSILDGCHRHDEQGVGFRRSCRGRGPGGSSAATALARRGKRVVLLERERFPRFHIGESQLPWSNEVFRALGADEAIAAAGFVKKWGASFRRPDDTTEQYADFEAAVETPTPQTFQVLRERFDEILLRHSAQCGVAVREGHRLLDAAFDAEAVTLRFADPDGIERTNVWGSSSTPRGGPAFSRIASAVTNTTAPAQRRRPRSARGRCSETLF